MRWFKHMAMAHEDEAMSAMLEDQGLDAYGFYWLLLEQIAATMETKTTRTWLVHSEQKWATNLHTSVRTFRRISAALHRHKLIIVEEVSAEIGQPLVVGSAKGPPISATRVKIDVPKLLKYRDEWSQRSGVTRDHRTDTDTDTDTEQKQKQNGATAPSVRDVLASGIVPNQPRWKSDPEFRSFRDAASSAWGDLIDKDFEESYKTWRTLDFEQRLACMKGIDVRVAMAIDFKFVPRPAKFLATCEYYRPVVPSKPTIIDQSRSQSLAVMDAMKKARKG